jgi:predicted transcriptional regulator
MRVITVRMTPELHQALSILAHEQRTTMNKVCVGLIEEAVKSNPVAGAMYGREQRQQEERREPEQS